MAMATYDQLLTHLVETADPPVPNRTTALAKPVGPAKTKHIVHCGGLALLVAVPGAALFYYGHWIPGSFCAALAALLLSAAFSSNLWLAACPYCSAVFEPLQGLKPDAEGKIVQCKECFEYSIYSGGRVRPSDPKAVSEVPKFKSPVYADGVWPRGCVACGAPPTRLDDVTTRQVNAGMLVLGRLWVHSASASGIPYCEAHRKAVDLKYDQRKRVWLEWCSLQMMRRYLAANRKAGTKAVGRKWL